jgi:hypothetical protein
MRVAKDSCKPNMYNAGTNCTEQQIRTHCGCVKFAAFVIIISFDKNRILQRLAYLMLTLKVRGLELVCDTVYITLGLS